MPVRPVIIHVITALQEEIHTVAPVQHPNIRDILHHNQGIVIVLMGIMTLEVRSNVWPVLLTALSVQVLFSALLAQTIF